MIIAKEIDISNISEVEEERKLREREMKSA